VFTVHNIGLKAVGSII